jgi:hypothetical protein
MLYKTLKMLLTYYAQPNLGQMGTIGYFVKNYDLFSMSIPKLGHHYGVTRGSSGWSKRSRRCIQPYSSSKLCNRAVFKRLGKAFK